MMQPVERKIGMGGRPALAALLLFAASMAAVTLAGALGGVVAAGAVRVVAGLAAWTMACVLVRGSLGAEKREGMALPCLCVGDFLKRVDVRPAVLAVAITVLLLPSFCAGVAGLASVVDAAGAEGAVDTVALFGLSAADFANRLGGAAYMFVCGSLFEELLFRVLLPVAIVVQYGGSRRVIIAVLLIPNVLFGAFHVADAVFALAVGNAAVAAEPAAVILEIALQFLSSVAFGVALQMVIVATGSIVGVCVLHFAVNLLMAVPFACGIVGHVSEFALLLSGGTGMLIAMLVCYTLAVGILMANNARTAGETKRAK